MRIKYQSIIVLSIILSFTISCKKEESPAPSTSQNKILALGASRVEGDSPNFESYRYELWKDLIDGGHTFDFIGSVIDPNQYANHAGQTFDPQHEGYSGMTSGEVLSELNNYLSSGDVPDIVLLSSPGGNDALNGASYSQAVANVNSIIDALQANNSNVTIIIEKMAPAHSNAMTPSLISFINQMNVEVGNMATQKSTSTSQILVVDMHTGFTDAMLADDVHYNQSGADFIASRYYSELVNVLQ